MIITLELCGHDLAQRALIMYFNEMMGIINEASEEIILSRHRLKEMANCLRQLGRFVVILVFSLLQEDFNSLSKDPYNMTINVTEHILPMQCRNLQQCCATTVCIA